MSEGMLLTTVILPECFKAERYADERYCDNMVQLLRGIFINGLILVDEGKLLRARITRHALELIESEYGKTATISKLLEELLLSASRGETGRIVATQCRCEKAWRSDQMSHHLAKECNADCLITDSTIEQSSSGGWSSPVKTLQVSAYLREMEGVRLNYAKSASFHKGDLGRFDEMIKRSTRFSRRLHFYDKQIGKLTNLRGFLRGIERILSIWVGCAEFKRELSVKIFTLVDLSGLKRPDPEVAYHKIIDRLVKPLQSRFKINVELSYKQTLSHNIHARFLETDWATYSFDRGFDFLDQHGELRDVVISSHDDPRDVANWHQLDEYSRLASKHS